MAFIPLRAAVSNAIFDILSHRKSCKAHKFLNTLSMLLREHKHHNHQRISSKSFPYLAKNILFSNIEPEQIFRL